MSDFLDLAPTLPRYDRETEDALLLGRRPGLGEFLGANVGEGWWGTTPGVLGAAGSAMAEGERDPRPIAREEWPTHPLYREGVAWDERMTEGRARAIATVNDENRYRRALMQARDASTFETVLGFGGMLVGSIPDPVNFVPIAGPLSRLARTGAAAAEAGVAARMLTATARTLDRPGVAGSALRGSVDALGGTIAAAPLVYGIQEQFGDEITFNGVLADLAIGALIGAGFGAVGGLIGRAREGMDQRAAVRVLDAIARDVAAGRPPEVPGQMAAEAVESAIIRAAPLDALALLPPGGGRLADLPTRSDGAPLTREEFDARLDKLLPDAADARTVAEARARALQDTLDETPTDDLAAPRIAAEADRAVVAVEDAPAGEARGGDVEQSVAAREARARALQDALDNTAPDDPAAPRLAEAADRAVAEVEAARADAYRWYAEAVAARVHVARLASTPRAPDMADAANDSRAPAGETRQNSAEPGATRDGGADPETTAALDQIQALRAEGRLGAADDAVLRAGDDAAAELDAVANGLEGAAACMLRNVA